MVAHLFLRDSSMKTHRLLIVICLFLCVPISCIGWSVYKDRQLMPLSGEDGEYLDQVEKHNRALIDKVERDREAANQN